MVIDLCVESAFNEVLFPGSLFYQRHENRSQKPTTIDGGKESYFNRQTFIKRKSKKETVGLL